MKLVLSSFLMAMASAASTEQRDLQQLDPTDLAARWDMTEPDINYDQTTDVFTFTFLDASSDNYNAGLEETFWDEDCMPATAGATGYPIGTPYITDDVNTGNLPTLTMENVGAVQLPQMTFKINPNAFATSGPGQSYSTPTAASSLIKFCIRSSLGYTFGPSNTYQEVNFIETLVEITYDMSSGFSVDAFSVAPKDRITTTISETYEDAVEAYLCRGVNHPDHDDTVDMETVTLTDQTTNTRPKRLNDYTPTQGGTSKFNQGALINVCVKVKDEFIVQGIRLNGVTTFTWDRTGGSTFDKDVNNGSSDVGTPNSITQQAIVAGSPAPNYLTSFEPNDCITNKPTHCDFASVLFAQFYNTAGTVTGAGDANLQFASRRRLGASNDGRQLQEEPGSAGVDISIDVNENVEGPGDLKTAAGPSLSYAVAAAVALVGSVFLA